MFCAALSDRSISKDYVLQSPDKVKGVKVDFMVAGPMDYTPGAMLNSNKDEFHVSMTSPMSRGTRAHQTSMYVLYDSRLQMLCDNPSNYLREPVYTHYIARFPTVWDKTRGDPAY